MTVQEQLEKARGVVMSAGWTLAVLVVNQHPDDVLRKYAQRTMDAEQAYRDLIAELAVHE